jgi:hypothetical protein
MKNSKKDHNMPFTGRKLITILLLVLITACTKDEVITLEPTSSSNLLFNKKLNRTQSGFQGFIYENKQNGGIGNKIPNVTITFTSEDKRTTRKVTTDSYGHYKILLPVARYYAQTEHRGYLHYSSAPGFFVVTKGKYTTGNFFLTKGTSGFQGFVYEEKQNGELGKKIPNATIYFTSEDRSSTIKVVSDKSGFYKISLPVARYYVIAKHWGHKRYSSAPGFFVVSKDKYNTGNIPLKKGRYRGF